MLFRSADLAGLDLPAAGEPEPFDVAVLAGNVLAYVAPDTETRVLSRIRAHIVPGGFAIVGCQTDRYPIGAFDTHAREAGFLVEQRFATWDARPWHADADFAVTVLRNS